MTATGPDFESALRAAIDGKTKPPGSLGRIEELAAQIARLQGTLTPRMETCRHIVFAADHGIAEEGVSAYPRAVTREMVRNFLAGGAASNVFARVNGIALTVVDAGVAGAPIEEPGLVSERIAPGTESSLHGPAMTAEQRDQALAAGKRIAGMHPSDALALGEMGIGNTSAAALVAAKVTGLPVRDIAGRGTGLDAEGFARKLSIVETAAGRTHARLDGSAALAEYGGFEIAMMAGAMIAAAEAGRIVLVDGFIATAAAAVALDLAPEAGEALVFAHLSAEQGHARVCEAIGASPLLALGLRLGEGTGALLAWPLVKAAAAMLSEMASFDSAGVSRAE